MEVILKPTSHCNFACTFCSACLLELLHQSSVPKALRDALSELNPQNIIVTGGEPLMVLPSYYELLLSLGSWTLSFTSNLKDFYLNPRKWEKLFKDSRVGVCTSFLYGEARKWDQNTIYDESMFIKVFDMFKSYIGYSLAFLSVISYENEKSALKHLQLAKRLKTKCKLNCMMPLGRSKSFYPLCKLLKILLDAIDLGYADYLCMDVCFNNGGCNFNTAMKCQSTIRALTIDSNGKLLCSSCEDDLVKGEYTLLTTADKGTILTQSELVTKNCLFCELYYLCNGCKQMRVLNKLVPNHCIEMKKLLPRIKNTKWRILP